MKETTNNKSSYLFLSFGETLWDIIEGEPHIGGAPFNVAAHMAKCGNQSYMLTSVGNDDFGKKASEKINQLHVSSDFIQVDHAHPTGTVDVFLQEGQPDYTIHENVAWDHIKLEEGPLRQKPFDTFYFGTLAQRSKISRETVQWILKNISFDTVFYDVNLRKGTLDKEIICFSLSHCHVFKLNVDEVKDLSILLFDRECSVEDFSRKIKDHFGVETLIITASEKGCYIFSQDQLKHIAGKQVKVVDAVGAGDAFSAAFINHYQQTRDAFEAARIANFLGAFVAGSRGAIPEYSEEIKRIINNP